MQNESWYFGYFAVILPGSELQFWISVVEPGKMLKRLLKLELHGGIDMAPHAISYCKKRGLSHVRIGVAEKTGFPKNSLDVVTLLDVLEHTDDKKAVEELQRIVKSGGMLS